MSAALYMSQLLFNANKAHMFEWKKYNEWESERQRWENDKQLPRPRGKRGLPAYARKHTQMPFEFPHTQTSP